MLASALLKINGDVARIPQRDLREVEAGSAFFIIPVASREFWANLVATHPPVEQRIRQLQEIQAEMEGAR